MDKFKKEELTDALQIVSSTISKCEKMQLKFEEGTSQHTLLKNRIKAMYISKSLLTDENVTDTYTKDELIESLKPVSSVINKCEKAKLKLAGDTSHYKRLTSIINAMFISKSLITEEINNRD
ncbi:hypothetical protein [Sedimentibacter sp.]|uniref:hypothetical protein n=1 Tax=Sedimentibacter sp. TaxID=1960295 RepID=UPI0028AA2B36|nr:hypothetical protein [Sedimentibacter sp.]